MKQAGKAGTTTQAKALFSKGLSHHQAGKLSEARAAYRQLLKLFPDQADALHMLGVAEFQEKNFEAAVSLISKAKDARPDNFLMHFNLGNAFRSAGRLSEASKAFSTALALRPDHLDSMKNLGNTYKEQNMMAEAIRCYDQILTSNPTHAHTLYNKGVALLTQGNLSEGWDFYENRLQCDTSDGKHLGHSFPRFATDWDGQPLDKPLLILPEQGLGDQIFYGAMLSDLQKTGVESFVCLDGRLQSLFGRSFSNIDFILPTDLNSLDPQQHLFGAQIQIASLGRLFRKDPIDLSQIRSHYLKANNESITAFREQYRCSGRLLCGLSWASTNAETSAVKSINLDQLQPLLKVQGVDFINLQYGDTLAERRRSKDRTGIEIIQAEGLDTKHDIDNLAALISACDVVITVSNSTAHLAAALGKPTLVLLAHHTPLWYWHLEADTTPWYPSVILLRQQIAGDWTRPIASAVSQLKTRIEAPSTHAELSGGSIHRQ